MESMNGPSHGLFRLVYPTIGILLVVFFIRCLVRLYQVRTLFRDVAKKHGIVSWYLWQRVSLFVDAD